MATIIRAGDCCTQEQVVFTAGGAIGLTTANYAPSTGIARGQEARGALLNLESNNIRYHVVEPAIAPDANSGMLFVKGDYLLLDSPQQIQCFQGITTAGGNVATAVVFYFF